MSEEVRVVPADRAGWEAVQTVLGPRGAAHRCQCQRFRLGPGESFGSFPEEERADRLRRQVEPPAPDRPTSGLVGYLGAEPVGWCAVGPRSSYAGLVRVFRVPWEGREEDRHDPTVWAVTCVFTRAGFRRRGVSRALIAATVQHARSWGARALEGYPVVATDVISEELHVGTVAGFEAAGFTVVGRPTLRRAVVRQDLDLA